MKTFTAFFKVLGMSITLSMCMQTIWANDGLSTQEADSLIKDDIAAMQVLTEICPAFLGKNERLEQNSQKIIATYLKGYSNQSMTFTALKNDSEYKTLLNDAKKSAKEMDHHEQHELCEDLINYQE